MSARSRSALGLGSRVRDLKASGSIELVKEEPRRGAVERFYRAVGTQLFHNEASWAKLSRSTQEEISRATFQGLVVEVTCALDERTLDARTDRHLSRVCMRLDERGCREALECQNALLARIERIKAESAERLQAKGERGMTFLSGIIGIELPPGRGLTDRKA